MTIKKYYANADTTITNAYESNLTSRGTGSNMGASDVLEVFSIYGQGTTSSAELSRTLIRFPITGTTSILTDRNNGVIPKSGSVSFYLKLYNAKHAFTLPRDFTLTVAAVSKSWAEGTGLDMEEYSDLGHANWLSASVGDSWYSYGGDFHGQPRYDVSFSSGNEDLEVDITQVVEETIKGIKENHGLAIALTASQEAYFSSSLYPDTASQGIHEFHNPNGARKSYYTKKFFSRGTQYFYKQPAIEARWESFKKDNTGNFYLSSSLVNSGSNLNTLYFYNLVRGQLSNVPKTGGGSANNSLTEIYLSVFTKPGTSSYGITLPAGGGVASSGQFNVTGGLVSTGIYSASFAYTGAHRVIYPIWHHGTSVHSKDNTEYHTGSGVKVLTFDSHDYNPNPQYFTKITNLKPTYNNKENARLRLYTRSKDWSPTIYSKASKKVETEIIDDAFYRAFRVIDDFTVIPYATGSGPDYTKLSYDVSGNYFDLDMSLFESGYAYAFKFVYYINGSYHEQPEVFKFRVE